MTRPLLLDLFCGLGGASVGYRAAGFDILGVDLSPQPDYPFPFIQADALEYLRPPGSWAAVAAIHASPPCAAYAAITRDKSKHPRLYEPTLELLEQTGLPFVIENPAARADVVLCGEMFGLGVLRHRRFELGNWSMPQPAHLPHRGRVRGWRHGEYFDGPYVAVYGATNEHGRNKLSRAGGGKANLQEAQAAMGIPWSDNLYSITQAIPPAFTECLGRELLQHVR